ncbi:kinase-like domain-containing protein [Flammula alnicola]|nr:kinase-like domain-containing protein [Flammula alnicola]
MTAFSVDFQAYLEKITGVGGWEVEELLGGAANFTVRVQPFRKGTLNDKRRPDDKASLLLEILNAGSTVIIKQAPAFLAKTPEIPFSPYRQIIEAEALRIFHPLDVSDTGGLHGILVRNPGIRVPKLLHHDEASNILVQSDLGSLPDLYEVLTSSSTPTSTAAELGKVVERFKNLDAERVMQSIIAQVARFMQDAGIPDCHSLSKIAVDHWTTRRKTAFGQGDLWFGTLLVDTNPLLPGLGPDKSPIAVGVCDWEFAGPNDPAADIAQLGT